MRKYVYHASKVQNLKKIAPKLSTHKIPWVYATKDLATSAMFLGEYSDFICQPGMYGEIPYIYERFEGAFNLAFKNKKGSIYKLSAKNFEEGKTSWDPEVVSNKEERVLEEIKIGNSLEFLEQLGKNDELRIYKYPNQPEGTPTDKSDLIERAIEWTIDFGEETLKDVSKYHPDILNKVIDELRKKKFKFKK